MTDYERYERLRNLKGLKNSDVARIANIPPSTFTDWKKGKSSPKLEKLQKIADAIGVSMIDIKGATKGSTESKALELASVLFQAKNENKNMYFFTKDEIDIIKKFNELDEEYQRQIILMIAFYKDQQDKNK